MKYIDSHAHVFYDGKVDGYEIVDRIMKKGLSKVLIVCCTIEEAYHAIELAKINSIFDVAVGIHPSDINDYDFEILEEIETLCSNDAVVAIGEIGLDYYWHKDNIELQKEWFIKQIEIANRLNKPIIVHSRDSIEETYKILEENKVIKKGIMHCYSSSYEMALKFTKIGYYISLAGPVTFKNGVQPKKVAKNLDMKYLLLETDSPFLTPEPYRGKKNEPNYVEFNYLEVAKIKEIDVKVLIDQVLENYMSLFHEKN